MCLVSSSAWTAQNHRPQMPQWDVAAQELQGSAIGENRLTGPLEAPGISVVRHLAVVTRSANGGPTLPITSFGCSRSLAMTASSGTLKLL